MFEKPEVGANKKADSGRPALNGDKFLITPGIPGRFPVSFFIGKIVFGMSRA
jgi:hypothetical protein